MSLETFAYLFIAGGVCGAINAVAGGATLIGFPVLISVGLTPSMANASNFLATMPGYAAAIPSYFKEIKRMRKAILVIILASVFGGMLGSLILIASPSAVFVKLTPYLLLVATLLYAFGGVIHRYITRKRDDSLKDSFIGKFVIFIFSIYGGYFGAGLGIIVLSILKIIGFHDYHEANAIKSIMITAVSIFSIVIFIAGGLISWPESIVMMVGSAMGGYNAAKYAKNIPQVFLKNIIVVIGLSFSAYYFYSA
ncbi:MAG: sulfite exporter TauE/SafE family protein [Oceanospirillaceae bacterium]